MIDEQLDLVGAVLFRGLAQEGVEGAADFAELVAATGYRLNGYRGGVTIRPELAAGVFPLSAEPPSAAMEPHVDLPYLDVPPRKLFFYCHRLPTGAAAKWANGGNPIVDTRKLCKLIEVECPLAFKKFERCGVQYLNHFPDRKNDDSFVHWQMTYRTEDREAAEALLSAAGWSYEWLPNGDLIRSRIAPVSSSRLFARRLVLQADLSKIESLHRYAGVQETSRHWRALLGKSDLVGARLLLSCASVLFELVRFARASD
eukprot:SAG31_NODE_6760_length_1895_cov_2.774499_1_plen_258_part_00